MQTTKAVASLQAEIAQLRHELQTVKVEAGSAAAPSDIANDGMFVGQYLIERLVQLGVTVRASRPPSPPRRAR